MTNTSLVILGSGYTGRHLLPVAARRYARVFATSRDPDRRLSSVPGEHRIRFDLQRPDTWKDIPKEADLLWCFPAAPRDLVAAFAATLHPPPRRIVVLGSTSAYDVGHSDEYPPPWIDETAPIDLTKPRVQGEEHLRKEHGAIVLRVAGTYGPGRHPLDWIKSGRVSPSRKFVNLIHVEDLAAVCLAALQHGVPGEIYNVSDGTPRTWKEICDRARARFGITSHTTSADAQPGKRISIATLSQKLGCVIRHPDLFDAMAALSRPLSEATP